MPYSPFMLRLLIAALLVPAILAQTALHSVSIDGTSLSKDFVLEIAGLHIGAPIEKAGIEAACEKLRDSGIFSSIDYRYTEDAEHNFALILTVRDQGSLSDATIDVPGIDESEAWVWLASRYASFNRKVPGNDAAWQFIAAKLEQHLGAKLEGQHLVARMEAELMPRRRTIVSFQPETLPRIASLAFSGEHELTAAELSSLVVQAVGDRGFIERHFREAIEMNLRPAYEKHGMYRVRFPSITVRKTSPSSVVVTTTVEEGPQYTLGDVQFVGERLPVDAMFQAAQFKKGEVANWAEIQRGIWDAERPVRRSGYMAARADPQRIFQDDRHVLDLRIPFVLGPLYRFGKLTVTGLTASTEEQMRKQWKLQPGDPFDPGYGRDFLNEWVRSVNDRTFKRFNVKTSNGSGPNVMDFELVFEPR